jgi:hypothetical protein
LYGGHWGKAPVFSSLTRNLKCYNVLGVPITKFAMIFSKKGIRKLLIVLALLTVNVWFWGSAAIQINYHYLFTTGAIKALNLNQVPVKMELSETEINGEDLHFYGFTIKMPFVKKEIDAKVDNVYMRGQLQSIWLHIKRNDKFFADVYIVEDHTWTSNKTVNYTEILRSMHYARLSDLSWWNTYGNWKLVGHLTLKAITKSAYVGGYYNVYDIETQHVKGYLVEAELGNLINESFDFALDNRSYHVSILSRDGSYGLRNLIGSIRPGKGVERSHDDMSNLYRNNPGYPDDLLLLSMISIKGPVEDYQKEYLLKGLEESLEYALKSADEREDSDYEDMIREDISDLKAGMEKGN